MKPQLFIAALLISTTVQAQDLTGTWEATQGVGTAYAKIVMIKCGSGYVGYTTDSDPGFCSAHFAGEYHEGSQQLKGVNKGMIRKTSGHAQCRYELRYDKLDDGTHILQGIVTAKSGFLRLMSEGAIVKYKRTSTNTDTTTFMYKCLGKTITNVPDDPADDVKINPTTSDSLPTAIKTDSVIYANIKTNRQNDTISTIYTNHPTIRISLFDNGQIDGDTVTVLHNNSVITSRHGVTGNPYKFEVLIDPEHPRHEVVLIAHNVGSIPPNTAVVTIEAGNKTYRLTASTDLNKNSVIIIEYRE